MIACPFPRIEALDGAEGAAFNQRLDPAVDEQEAALVADRQTG